MKQFTIFMCSLVFTLRVCAEPSDFESAEIKEDKTIYEEKSEKEDDDKENNFDLVARKIAGTYVEDDKKLDSDRVAYVQSVEKSWKTLYDDSLSKIPEWTDKYITPFVSKYDTVFYPFGGPDIAYVFSFFPKASRFILVGLEPLGSFEKIEKSLSNSKAYNSIRKAFNHYLRKGYFITSEMLTQLSNTNIRGGLNLVLLGISRMGYTVTHVRSCGIDSDGKIVDSGIGNVDCIEIQCEKGDEKKSVYYVRINLHNSNSRLYNLMQFVYRFEFVTFIKSASYILHDNHFSKIRSFILKEANCLLQDDTGIPFNFFRENWDVHIFGKYTRPTLPIFRTYKQNSLEDYYSQHLAEPITFPIGYGYIQRNPNLIFAVSKTKLVMNQMREVTKELAKKKCNCIFE